MGRAESQVRDGQGRDNAPPYIYTRGSPLCMAAVLCERTSTICRPAIACREGYAWGPEARLPGHFPLDFRANQHFVQVGGWGRWGGECLCGKEEAGEARLHCWLRMVEVESVQSALSFLTRSSPVLPLCPVPTLPCPQPKSMEVAMAMEVRRGLGQLAVAKQNLCMEQVRLYQQPNNAEIIQQLVVDAQGVPGRLCKLPAPAALCKGLKQWRYLLYALR